MSRLITLRVSPEKRFQKGLSHLSELPLPNEWVKIPIHDLVDKGYRPRVKKVKGIQYLTLRQGNSEKSLGHYTEERWDLLLELFPRLKVAPKVSPAAATPILSTRLGKPRSVKKAFNPSLETLGWHAWCQQKGYAGELDEFVNDIVHNYFYEKGFMRPVVIVRG